MTVTLLALALVAAAAPAGSALAPDLAVQAGSTVSYRLVHKLHEVTGTSREVEGRVLLLPDGRVQAMVRARVASFDSGNSSRDAHMKEVVEEVRFPLVTVKAASRLEPVAAFPAELRLPLRLRVELHGVARELEATARVRFASADRAEVDVTFPVSLTAHAVERPALLFVPVEDRIDVTAHLALAPVQP